MKYTLPPLLALAVCCSTFPSIAQQSDEERRTAAQSKFWSIVKAGLSGGDSSNYWEAAKDAAISGVFANGYPLRGTVLSSTSPDRPGELILAMSDDHTPEVTLKLYGEHGKPFQLTHTIEPGTLVEFKGAAKAFTKEPFMLTLHLRAVGGRSTGLWIFDKGTKKFEPYRQ